jgi:hypothetical protein
VAGTQRDSLIYEDNTIVLGVNAVGAGVMYADVGGTEE